MNQTPMDGFLVGIHPDDTDHCHASFQMGGPDFSGISGLVMSRFSCPRESRFPDGQYADPLRISDTCPSERTAQVMSRDFHYGSSRSLVHGNADGWIPEGNPRTALVRSDG
jgi:hypothetical protein